MLRDKPPPVPPAAESLDEARPGEVGPTRIPYSESAGVHASMNIGDRLRRAAKLVDVLDAAAYAANHRSDLGAPVLYDIGGRGGLHRRWGLAHRFGLVQPILFEPDPAERARLTAAYGESAVIGFAAGDVEGPASLYVTAEPGCSSLLEPDIESLRTQGLLRGREVVARLPVETRRIDSMIGEGLLPPPTYLKIDVQGFEKRVLDGMGAVIDGVVAIELESRLVPAYQGETLFPEMIDSLRGSGFGLIALRPLGLADGSIVETNAYFARTPSRLGDHRSSVQRTFWRKLMGLPTHGALISSSS
jgi:FkbM family methyltransferase